MALKYITNCMLPTAFGNFTLHGFKDVDNSQEHIALTLGTVSNHGPILGRIHSECLTGDALFSHRCDCGSQIKEALKRISKEGCGVLLYLRQEGRGIGLLNKIRAYHLQDHGYDTIEANLKLGFKADTRKYDVCIPMLKTLGIYELKLMTNNPDKLDALTKAGVNIAEHLPLTTGLNRFNKNYLYTKMKKLGHTMSFEDYYIEG